MINVLAVTHHARENINPIRPEASQIIGLHKTGKVRVIALIKDRDIKILHLFNNIACCNGAMAAIGTDVKAIAYRGQTGNMSRIDPLSYLTLLHPRLDKIICVAKAVELELKTHLGRHKDKAVTVYKGHDSSWYQNPKADLSGLKLPEDSFIISLVANLRPRKGLPVLMEALSLLPKDTNLDVLLVGVVFML